MATAAAEAHFSRASAATVCFTGAFVFLFVIVVAAAAFFGLTIP
jgi:hypothetical protein